MPRRVDRSGRRPHGVSQHHAQHNLHRRATGGAGALSMSMSMSMSMSARCVRYAATCLAAIHLYLSRAIYLSSKDSGLVTWKVAINRDRGRPWWFGLRLAACPHSTMPYPPPPVSFDQAQRCDRLRCMLLLLRIAIGVADTESMRHNVERRAQPAYAFPIRAIISGFSQGWLRSCPDDAAVLSLR